MTGMIELDRLLYDQRNATIVDEIYKSQMMLLEEAPTVHDIVTKSRYELERKKMMATGTDIFSRVRKLEDAGIFIVIPGAPFTGSKDRIKLSELGQSYIGYVQERLRDYYIERTVRVFS